METPKNPILTLTDSEGQKTEITLSNWDADASDYVDAFRSLMFSAGFHIETINEFIPDPRDEKIENQNYN